MKCKWNTAGKGGTFGLELADVPREAIREHTLLSMYLFQGLERRLRCHVRCSCLLFLRYHSISIKFTLLSERWNFNNLRPFKFSNSPKPCSLALSQDEQLTRLNIWLGSVYVWTLQIYPCSKCASSCFHRVSKKNKTPNPYQQANGFHF